VSQPRFKNLKRNWQMSKTSVALGSPCKSWTNAFNRSSRPLVEGGSFTRGKDAQPIIDKETWLQAQQVAIGRLARGEPM
jgi:hypothetical protein